MAREVTPDPDEWHMPVIDEITGLTAAQYGYLRARMTPGHQTLPMGPDTPRCHPDRAYFGDGLCYLCWQSRLEAQRDECPVRGCLGGRRCPEHRK